MIPGYAAGQPEPDAGEYVYAYLLPKNAENVVYANNGTILYKEGNEYKFIDGQTGDIIVAAVEHRVATRTADEGPTPKDLSPTWQYFRQDGPYSTNVDLFAVMDALEDIADWSQVCIWLGIPAILANWIKGKVNGGYTKATYWRIDHAYNNPDYYGAYMPYTRIHIESYFYSGRPCVSANYLGNESREMSAGA